MNESEKMQKYELEVTKKYMSHINDYINKAMVRYEKDCDNAYNRQIMKKYENLVHLENGRIVVSKSGCVDVFMGYFMNNFDNGTVSVSKLLFNILYVPNNIMIIHLNNKIHHEIHRLREKYLDNPNSEYCIYKKIQGGLDELFQNKEETLELIEYLGIDEFYNQAIKNVATLEPFFEKFVDDIQPLKELFDKRNKKLHW